MMKLVSLLLLGLSITPAWSQANAVFSDTGPDADAYGRAEGYPIGQSNSLGTQRHLVGNYSHMDELRPSRVVAAPPVASVLPRAPQELKLDYVFQGQKQTLESYLERNPATGLLILSDRTIQFEHYRYARTDRHRLNSQSMAKTIVSMSLGVALGQGSIRSVDDTVADYVPELANTETGRTPLRALLQMTSGLRFHEVYDGKDDIMRLSRALMQPDSTGATAIAAGFDVRSAAPGTVFNYAGLDTELLSLVIVRATGMPLTDFVARNIWAPIGAEAAASWVIDSRGHELAFCCFNAVLRDWGRFGALLANDGVWDGKQVIPKQWLLDATTAQSPLLTPGVNGRRFGYGYQVWLLPGDRRQFALRGIYGQSMLIDPATHTVLVHTAARPMATNNVGEAELTALWNALIASKGG